MLETEKLSLLFAKYTVAHNTITDLNPDNVNREQVLGYWQSTLFLKIRAAWHNMI